MKSCLFLLFFALLRVTLCAESPKRTSVQIPLAILRGRENPEKEDSKTKEFDTVFASAASVQLKRNFLRLKGDISHKIISLHDAVVRLEFHNVTKPKRIARGVFLAEIIHPAVGRTTRSMRDVVTGNGTVDVSFDISELVSEAMEDKKHSLKFRMRLLRMPKKLPRGLLRADLKVFFIIRGYSPPDDFSRLVRSWSGWPIRQW